MEIVGASAHRQWQPFRDGPYATAGGVAEGFDSTVVALHARDGTVGWGEAAPLGAFYADAFPAGVRAAVAELLPVTVGASARAPAALARRMGAAMRAQPAAKAAIDMAAWDLAARLAGASLAELLGGADGAHVDLYRSVSPGAPEAMAAAAAGLVAEGYRRVQVKVGARAAADADRLAAVRDAVGPGVDLTCDANGAWSTGEAIRFLRLTADVPYTLEQPCATLPECALVRRRCERPLALDEVVCDLPSLLAARSRAGADAVTIKLARVGGVTPAALLRDVAADLGLEVTVEDTGGADLATAAMLHVSLGTPRRLRRHTVDFNAWVTVANATGVPPPRDGAMAAPAGPGLGVEVDAAAVGRPFAAAPC